MRRYSRSLVVAAALLGVALWLHERGPVSTPPAPVPAEGAGEQAILDAFARHRSGVEVDAGGVVDRVLADDNVGSRHQRFVVRLPSGHTVLVSHNIDLAPRVPVEPGDDVGFRGQYEWNDRGGVVHWTHHDPDRRRAGGYVVHRGRTYE